MRGEQATDGSTDTATCAGNESDLAAEIRLLHLV